MSGVFAFPLSIVIIVVYFVAAWKVYEKAGQPGWASIVPIYSLYILMRIIGRPGWWLILYFIPIANIVVTIINAIDLAKVFGRSAVFGIFGLWLFSFIGYLMLGFGSDTYKGPGNQTQSPLQATPAVAPVPQASVNELPKTV